MVQPSSRPHFSFAIITSYGNQITPVKHEEILKWKSKIQMNPRRIVRWYEWYKAKTFCCVFFAAAMLTMVASATIVRFPPVVLSSPASVCPCINHLFVRAITRDPFKLGSPNLNQRCKRPWSRSVLFWGAKKISRSNLTYKSELTHFELVRTITHHPFKLDHQIWCRCAK